MVSSRFVKQKGSTSQLCAAKGTAPRSTATSDIQQKKQKAQQFFIPFAISVSTIIYRRYEENRKAKKCLKILFTNHIQKILFTMYMNLWLKGKYSSKQKIIKQPACSKSFSSVEELCSGWRWSSHKWAAWGKRSCFCDVFLFQGCFLSERKDTSHVFHCFCTHLALATSLAPEEQQHFLEMVNRTRGGAAFQLQPLNKNSWLFWWDSGVLGWS